MVLINLTFMYAVFVVTDLIDIALSPCGDFFFFWTYCMLPSRVGSCAVFGWVLERGWSIHVVRHGHNPSTPTNCKLQDSSGGLHEACQSFTCQRLAHTASEFLQGCASTLLSLRLLSGQQEVLVSIGAQETRVAVTLHQLVDVVLGIFKAVAARVF